MNKPCLFVSALISLALTLAVSASQLREYGPIKDGDNLWAISKLLRPDDSIPVAHMMRLLFKHNPQAFINNDLDRLKKGAMIRVPDHLYSTTKAPEEQPHSVRPAESDTGATLLKQAQSNRSTKSQPSVHKSLNDNQKLPNDPANLAKLKREIDRLRQENATKANEINSLRSELLALRQASFTTEQQVTAATSIPTSVSKSDFAAQASSEATAIVPVVAEPLAEIGQKKVAKDIAEETNTDNNPLILVGLGVGVSVMVMIVGIMWRQGTIAIKLLEHSGQFTDAQAYSLSAVRGNQTEKKPEEPAEMLLTKADVQLTNGNYQQAEALLQQALAKNPSRDDIKLRLLQIYYKQKDQHRFGEYGTESNDVRKLTKASLDKSQNIDQTTEGIDDLRTSDLGKAESPSDTFRRSLQRAKAGLNTERVNDDPIDEVETKLELARACVDMGKLNRAQSIINEVMQEGTQTQRAQANTLIMQHKNRLLDIG